MRSGGTRSMPCAGRTAPGGAVGRASRGAVSRAWRAPTDPVAGEERDGTDDEEQARPLHVDRRARQRGRNSGTEHRSARPRRCRGARSLRCRLPVAGTSLVGRRASCLKAWCRGEFELLRALAQPLLSPGRGVRQRPSRPISCSAGRGGVAGRLRSPSNPHLRAVPGPVSEPADQRGRGKPDAERGEGEPDPDEGERDPDVRALGEAQPCRVPDDRGARTAEDGGECARLPIDDRGECPATTTAAGTSHGGAPMGLPSVIARAKAQEAATMEPTPIRKTVTLRMGLPSTSRGRGGAVRSGAEPGAG